MNGRYIGIGLKKPYRSISTWKSSQHYIIIIVMASFIRMPFMLVFHQSISALERRLFYYCHVCILAFFHVLVPCYCDAC